jgi:iron complex transport system permease protein
LNILSSSSKSARAAVLLAVLTAGALLLFAADLGSGSVGIPPGRIISILLGRSGAGSADALIILRFRLPKAIVALLAGAALACSGLILQTLFGNPLAGPDVLGLNAGASIGVALLLLGANAAGGSFFSALPSALGSAALPVAAAAGAALVLLGVMAVSARAEGNAQVLIAGLMAGFIAGSIVSFLVYFALPQKVGLYLSWTFGSFQGVPARSLPAFTIACGIGITAALLLAKPLDALLLGPRYAKSLGLDILPARAAAIAAASLLGGAVTAFCGPVAFLGIAAPHLGRLLSRSQSHALLMPVTLLSGSCLALAADILTQLPRNGSLIPLNPLLSLVGAPIVLWLALRRGKGAFN